MESYVKLTINAQVGYIEFFHPNKNAMPSDVLQKLEQTILEASKNEAVNVIVLKSSGNRTFCAGASLNELIAIEDAETGKQFFSGFASVINAMRKCSKLIVGRVQGKAVGGGVGLAAATDYCLATQYASIKLSELSIGIGPFVIEPAVSKKIGKTAMSQITIDAERFYSADWAKEKGLYTEIFNTTEELDEAVNALAAKLATYNPEALKEMKKVIWEGTSHWDVLLQERAAISGKLVLSKFTKTILDKYR
ncbi:enoyl-CoA hydratase/isomerase family protein [Seonamhaeicola sediminis]|uniref:Enoyl-CoA hydratase/isomerase family protein n=1 Tax=Seonamhaeicola sediminis TaxID=2528206 RepID=A0A562YHF7_9FLAO|nr:enoyl-CoA hydratase/isomerase family protein [Seonamhaeicola sediminis]TWO34463.1 enoyl-CoA hydratase/isomerase family protein [Seonamhaeicola sediminis]